MCMRLLLLLIFFWGSLFTASAQNGPWTRRIQAGLSPSANYRIISKINPNDWESHSLDQLSDSFRNHDFTQQSFGGYVGLVFQRERGKAFAVNVMLNQMGFIRRKEDNMFGYQPHPDLQPYAQLVSGPKQILDYHFSQTFLAFEFTYLKRLDGVKLIVPKTEIYTWFSISPAVNILDKVQIRTRGFTLEEGNNIDVYDYTVETNPLGEPVVKRVNNPTINVFMSAGLRAEYELDEKLKIMAQPRFDITALPSFQGVQRAHSFRFALDLGIVYPL